MLSEMFSIYLYKLVYFALENVLHMNDIPAYHSNMNLTLPKGGNVTLL